MPYDDFSFYSNGIELRGWILRAQAPRQGVVVYLHGIADNRQSGLGIARRLVPRGYDVLVYDSRAHGASGGTYCTYGFHEKHDLSRALDAMGVQSGSSVILVGHSLGAAIALQAAAVEPRVRGVIAVSSFSDLETIVSDRAPWFATRTDVSAGLTLAGRRGAFIPADASPVRAAARIHAPVLLIHGERDRETPAGHSRRILEALAGPKELFIAPQGDHNHILAREDVWHVIDDWWRRNFPS